MGVFPNENATERPLREPHRQGKWSRPFSLWVSCDAPTSMGVFPVEFVSAFGAVMLEGFEEELGVCGELEEASAVVGDGGDEEGPGLGGSWRDGHGWDCRCEGGVLGRAPRGSSGAVPKWNFRAGWCGREGCVWRPRGACRGSEGISGVAQTEGHALTRAERCRAARRFRSAEGRFSVGLGGFWRDGRKRRTEKRAFGRFAEVSLIDFALDALFGGGIEGDGHGGSIRRGWGGLGVGFGAKRVDSTEWRAL